MADEAKQAPEALTEDLAPPWIIFSDKGKPCAILAAGRPGEVVSDCSDWPEGLAWRVVQAANQQAQDYVSRMERLTDQLLAIQAKTELARLSEIPKPEVVDGEVTKAHREEALRLMYPRETGAPHAIAQRWIDGHPDLAYTKEDRVAQAIATAESRGFAAGRASVTAEGWVRGSGEGLADETVAELQWEQDGPTYPAVMGRRGWVLINDGSPSVQPARHRILWAHPAPADTELKRET